MGVRENKVETYLDNEITARGGITRKWVCPMKDGVPDRIVMIEGVVVFVEVKTTDGVLSPVQKREHLRLMATGVNVETVYGKESVDDFINQLHRLIEDHKL